MTVTDYALRQLHWIIQEDPWTQAVMRAGGLSLDQMAERILGIYNSADFSALSLAYVRYYERLLGLTHDETASLADRRAAIQAAWGGGSKPSLSSLQAICDSWQAGGVIASYEPGTLHLSFQGAAGIPANIETLQRVIAQAIPAQIAVNYIYHYLLIKEVHEVMTLTELESTPLSNFAAG